MNRNRNAAFYGGVFITCAGVMALQILQSRIFSVVTWYHLSFLVISIAMFGLTLGAITIYRGDAETQRRDLPQLLQATSFRFGLAIAFGLVVQMVFPILSDRTRDVLVTLPLVAGVTALGYFYAGQIVSLCLTRSALPVGTVYGTDLLGASTGCLAALGLMQLVDAPSAVLIVAGLSVLGGVLFASGAGVARRAVLLTGLGLIALGAVNASLPKPVLYTVWSKGVFMPESKINFEKWNSISRVTVVDGLKNHAVFLWGPSPVLPKGTRAEYQYLMIDGDASTPLTKFDGHSWNKLGYLRYDVTNIPYFMPGIKSAAIIGVGGGRDLLSARYFGAKKTVALDVNATQVSLLTKNPFYRDYTNLSTLPDSRIINSEARNWFSRNHEKFDVIQMSLIDTWAATGAGAFALSENSIYTVDAFKIFMDDLNPHGVLTVSRWQIGNSYSEIGRMLSMTVSALIDHGVSTPWENIAMVRSANIVTMIAGRDALTHRQLDAIERAAKKYRYTILLSPHRPPASPVLAAIDRAGSQQALLDAIAGLPYDLTPPGDMRPFFFNQAPVTRPWQIIKWVLSPAGNGNSNTANGQTLATLNLYIIILFSVTMAGLVLVLPFRGALNTAPAAFIRAGTAYFGVIGLGFMFVEISLMQIMTTFLGHPVYSLGIVLFSLILSTGVGSLISEKFPLRTNKAIIVWVSLLFVCLAGLSMMIGGLIKLWTPEPFLVRVALSVGLIAPCGLLMGYGFPTGMKLTEEIAARMTPWFWGINGACGVVASALAVFVGIGWGLDRALLVGALLYAVLALPALRLLRFSWDDTLLT